VHQIDIYRLGAPSQKIARINLPRHTSYQPVLIHAGAISDAISDEDYFAATIDFSDLLHAK
jgi:hypothetical protein